MVLYNVVFLGDGGVGKSALIIQYVRNLFCTEYDATIENSYRKQVTVDERTDMLDILDTAGQEDYAAMRDQYIRTGEAFVLVYSVASRSSFEQARALYLRIAQVKDEDERAVPVLLVGNKIDLPPAHRAVSTREGAALAAELGAHVRFVETSARTRAGIDELFAELVRALRSARKQTAAPHAAASSSASAAGSGSGSRVSAGASADGDRPRSKSGSGCTIL